LLNEQGLTRIAVEDPGSLGSREELAYWGLHPVPVPVDEHGLDVGELDHAGLAAVLVTPAHQFPTGAVLAPGRRRDLLGWAAEADALVIEDDYDAEYRYDRAPVPALQASAPDRVAYAGSTSKTLAPGMRLGWLIPPRRMHADLVTAKHAADLGSPALPQLVLARLIATGELERHIRLTRKRQRVRRDALLRALREHLPGARVQGIAAGLHLLITFPGLDLRDTDLAEEIQRTGVLVHPLSWHRQRAGVPGLVLGYAAHAPGQLQDAVRRIGQVLRDSGAQGPDVPLGPPAAFAAALTRRASARRCLRAVARSWLIRAAPARTTRSTPQTAASSNATPSGRWPWAPKYAMSTVLPFSRMNISRSSSTMAKKATETHTPPALVRWIL
jgi:GntR family transcriptional regulator/MocR family aminotransferase